MDCLEFRRLLGSDPRVADPAARAHLETCPRCQDAFARAQAFEARIASALAVAVPEGLADRVLLAQLTAERQRHRGFRYGWIALAAAAALVVAVGLVRREGASARSLPDLVVAHVNGPERPALALRAQVPSSEVERAFAERGVQLASVPAGISYVHKCPVGDYRTVHMVMPKDDRPVSVLYVTHYHASGVTDFERDALHGREVPIADGTLVMVAENTSAFDAIEHDWRDAIEGSAEIATGSR
ncbi:MAG TPA: DUF3379 family protein [Rhodanobacteraceae bacterium]|jgi:hypothetical protein|nr:DUF3379 family protein [Rhodanobacteraceae bacterium]